MIVFRAAHLTGLVCAAKNEKKTTISSTYSLQV